MRKEFKIVNKNNGTEAMAHTEGPSLFIGWGGEEKDHRGLLSDYIYIKHFNKEHWRRADPVKFKVGDRVKAKMADVFPSYPGDSEIEIVGEIVRLWKGCESQSEGICWVRFYSFEFETQVSIGDLTMIERKEPKQEREMKIEIYGESKKEEKEPVKLRLIDKEGGDICLVAVDRDGAILPAGHLITITPSGTVRFNLTINPELGFPLDSEGRLVVE